MRPFCLTVAVLVSACAGSPPAAPTDWATPELRADLDPVLVGFLAEVVRVTEAHDWSGLSQRIDRDAFEWEVDFYNREGGIEATAAASEILESALGLGYVATQIYPAGASRAEAPFAGLDRIRRLSFLRVADRRPQYGATDVAGEVLLDDGQVLSMDVTVLWEPPGRPFLVVPLG